MWIYLVFLLLGVILGLLLKNVNIGKVSKIIMNSSIIVLLFFMGVGIGKDPHLSDKILSFGLYAFIIAFFAVIMSTFIVYLLVRFFRRNG